MGARRRLRQCNPGDRVGLKAGQRGSVQEFVVVELVVGFGLPLVGRLPTDLWLLPSAVLTFAAVRRKREGKII